MATISSCPNFLFQQPPATTGRRCAISTSNATLKPQSSASSPSSSVTLRGRPSHVVSATTDQTTTTTTTTKPSVVGDMERGELAQKSGRSDGQLAARWRDIHGENNWDGLLDPIDTTLRGELIRYGEFSQACYDSFDYDRFSRYCGTCRYPPTTFFRDVGLDGVGYTVSRYLYATSNVKVPNFQIFKHGPAIDPQLWSETATFMGFIAVSSDEETARIGRRDIAVAWRGTVTRLEWIADVTATQCAVADLGIPCPDRSVRVESGFGELYTDKDVNCRWCKYSAREQVLAEVRKLVELYHGRGEEVSVTVTGHSLGSALAMISAFDIAETGANVSTDGKKAPVCVFSYSGPRVGNPKFKDRFEKKLGVKALRIVNVHDKVPQVPGVLYVLDEKTFPEPVLRLLDAVGVGSVYVHLGVELALDHKVSPFLKDTLDIACYHNLEAHLHLLDGYQGRGGEFKLGGRDPALVNKAADFLMDEHMVPPAWRQDENKGMVRTDDGRWVLPPRDTEVHDHPEDTEHYLQQLGLISSIN